MLVTTLCVAWLRSYWRHDFVEVRYVHPLPSREVSELSLTSGKGGVSLQFKASWWNPEAEHLRHEDGDGWGWWAVTDTPDYEWTYLCRVGWEESAFGKRGRQGYGQRVVAPHALLLALVLARPAAAWGFRHIRDLRRRSRTGLCPSCGYDLRASPERCPECGLVSREPPHNPPMQRTATASSGAIK